ncbi:MAG TPA: phage portal protein [Enhygromyxa sp.]|nr:phage portal protein [Enhygromyxa sp.]
MDEEIEPSLARLRVLRLEDTHRVRQLHQLEAYYRQTQNDHLDTDWDGYRRTPGLSYLESRLDRGRYQPSDVNTVGYGYRRPICPTMVVGLVVDTYTALLLGEGRTPTIRVIGDDASTELLGALFESSYTWSALAQARRICGSVGAAAVVPEVVEGVPSLRVLHPANLYIEWADSADWTPELVIEQRKVKLEGLDDQGCVYEYTVWRTRAWTRTHVYVYEDLVDRERDSEDDEPEIELASAPVEHGAGRCPVVWIQNTHDTESPFGEPDCEPVLEQIDRMDRLQSMIARGATANVDPTLVVKDKPQMLARWPSRKKGYGQLIEVSDVGDAYLLEIAGKSVETSWLTLEKVRKQVDVRVGVITIDPEVAGNVLSGLAIKLLYRTQDTRAGARRVPLGKGVTQLGGVWLAMVRTHGIKAVGEDGEGIELPPREVASDPDDTGQGATIELQPHAIGPGKALALTWPSLHSVSPQELLTLMQGLGLATGGQAVLSQESAVTLAVNAAELDVDPATELERIRSERDAKVASFDKTMAPDIEGDLFGKEGDGDLEQPATTQDGQPVLAPGEAPPQQEARNGIQTKTMADTIARVGDDLAPEAARFVIIDNYPTVNAAEVDKAIQSQLDFRREKKANEPEPPVVPPAQRMAGLAKARAVQAGEAPEDEPDEDDGEEDELD